VPPVRIELLHAGLAPGFLFPGERGLFFSRPLSAFPDRWVVLLDGREDLVHERLVRFFRCRLRPAETPLRDHLGPCLLGKLLAVAEIRPNPGQLLDLLGRVELDAACVRASSRAVFTLASMNALACSGLRAPGSMPDSNCMAIKCRAGST
jgi:hypothetical protein